MLQNEMVRAASPSFFQPVQGVQGLEGKSGVAWSVVHGGVALKRTPRRIRVAPRSAFLVRWICSLAIVALILGAAPFADSWTMPGDNTNRTALREVKDETGRMVKIPQPVHRIVSLAPSVTETLFALGLGDRVVGDTDFCDYPPEAKKKTHIGGPVDPNIEAIAALHPDLVVATRSINRLASVDSLERLGIPVYATDPHTVEEVLASTERLGDLLGAGDAGRTLSMNLRERLSRMDDKLAGLPPQNVLMVVWLDPLISIGRESFLYDGLRRAGAHSVIDTSQPWPNINLEQVIKLQPKYLIFSSDDSRQVQRQLAELEERPAWQLLDAVRDRKFIVVGEALSHPSPRLIDGIEQLARALYPAQFAGSQKPAEFSAQVSEFLLTRLSQPTFAFSKTGGSP
jgi:iron complex transport system substrate-binding protein